MRKIIGKAHRFLLVLPMSQQPDLKRKQAPYITRAWEPKSTISTLAIAVNFLEARRRGGLP